MPYQPPHYSVPTFPPTGNKETDDALSQWASQFGQQHQETQEAASRTPFVVSTFTNNGQSLGAAPNNYLSKKVVLMGGEQVVVSASVEFTVKGSTANSDTAVGTLRVTYPGGSTFRLLGRNCKLSCPVELLVQGATTVKTTVSMTATVGFSWGVDAKFQNGGEHIFTLVTSGGGSANGASMDVLVL